MVLCVINDCEKSAEIMNKCVEHQMDDNMWRKIADWSMCDDGAADRLNKSTIKPWAKDVQWTRTNEFGKIVYPKSVYYFVMDSEGIELIVYIDNLLEFIPANSDDIFIMQIVWHFQQKVIYQLVADHDESLAREIFDAKIIKDSESISTDELIDILETSPHYYLENMRKHMSICCRNIRRFVELWPESPPSSMVQNILRAYNCRKYTLPIIAADVEQMDDSTCAEYGNISDNDYITTVTSSIFQVTSPNSLAIWTNSCWVECHWFLGIPSRNIECLRDIKSLKNTFKWTGDRVVSIIAKVDSINIDSLVSVIEESEFDMLTLQHIYGSVRDDSVRGSDILSEHGDWLSVHYNIEFCDHKYYTFGTIVDMCL
jgi:hypothetical protein